MPEIAPGVHKPLLEYFWVRILEDGETMESQFDLDTGEQRDWYPVSHPLTKVMWYPVYPGLAKLMRQHGEFGLAGQKKKVILELDTKKQVHRIGPAAGFFWGCAGRYEDHVTIGQRPYMYLLNDLHQEEYFVCTRCKNRFQWFGQGNLTCPACGSENKWKCERCGEVKPNPIFMPRNEVRCPDCAAKGRPEGLKRVNNIIPQAVSWLETSYVMGIEGEFEIVIGPKEEVSRSTD